MKFRPTQIALVAGGALLVFGIISLVVINLRPKTGGEKVSLVVWGFEDASAFKAVIEAYQRFRSNVEVAYLEVPEVGYKEALVNALAAGRGPDIFMIGNRDLPQELERITPMDSQQFNLIGFRDAFPAVAEQDFVRNETIYALPLYLDTLALFYNKDLFDQAGVVEPPRTWEDFQAIIPKLRVINESGKITRAAAAIGGSKRTIPTAVDIMSLLMLQNGTQMVSRDLTEATFGGSQSGLHAFTYYLQFANIASSVYTWSDSQESALDSFAAGKTAMVLEYQSALRDVVKRNPFVRVGVAPVLQSKGAGTSITFPRYIGLTVSRQSRASGWAWDFAAYVTVDPNGNSLYLGAASRPPALRSTIGSNFTHPDYAVFARQALTARSWYEIDDARIQRILDLAVQNVLGGRATAEQALRQAGDQVTQLMRLR
ncbi:extracellular solute-binding protein [Candidatus Parcubacteria bacterium]|nr:MAG: extracellular solute-binding protein [Candidatus Parcubacteria bacterium]